MKIVIGQKVAKVTPTIISIFGEIYSLLSAYFLFIIIWENITANVSRLQEVAMNQDQAITNITKTFN